MKYSEIKKEDIEVYKLIKKEEKRQKDNIELIASENFVSDAVLQAQGSILEKDIMVDVNMSIKSRLSQLKD